MADNIDDRQQASLFNGRTTMATLGVKVDYMRDDIQEIKKLLKEHCESEERWRDALSTRVRSVEAEQARQKERLSIWAAGQAIWTAIAAVIAGVFGK